MPMGRQSDIQTKWIRMEIVKELIWRERDWLFGCYMFHRHKIRLPDISLLTKFSMADYFILELWHSIYRCTYEFTLYIWMINSFIRLDILSQYKILQCFFYIAFSSYFYTIYYLKHKSVILWTMVLDHFIANTLPPKFRWEGSAYRKFRRAEISPHQILVRGNITSPPQFPRATPRDKLHREYFCTTNFLPFSNLNPNPKKKTFSCILWEKIVYGSTTNLP